MFQKKPDLIVPMHDRRRRRRILTLKNFGIAMAVLLVAFTVISIRSEMDHRNNHGYGRLLDRRLDHVEKPEAKPVEVIQEASPEVPDQTAADPMLIEPLEREQWLRDETQPVVAGQATGAYIAPPATAGELTMVGGPDGVTLVRKERRRPVLSGGFGR